MMLTYYTYIQTVRARLHWYQSLQYQSLQYAYILYEYEYEIVT